ncbi:MAG: GAF domain-containing protein [Bacteroidota bacterium]
MKKVNLNIKARFGVFLGIIIIAFAVIISLFVWSIRDVQDYNDYNLHVKELVVEYLTMRRFEQHFLLRHVEDEGFFKSGNNRYLRKHTESYNRLNNNLDRLIADPLTDKLELGGNLEKIKEFNNSYKQIFGVLAQKIYQKGSVSTGTIGKVNEDMNLAIELVNEAGTRKLILKLIKNVKDYLITKDHQNITKFEVNFNALSIHVGQGLNNESLSYTGSDETETVVNSGNELIATLNIFKEDFIRLIKMDEIIGLNSSEGLNNDLRTEIHKFDPEIESLAEAISGKKEESLKYITQLLGVFIGLLVLIIIFYIIRFSGSITRPIDKLNEYLQPLSKGILPDKLLILKQQNELFDMTKAINELIEGLKKTTSFAETIGQGVFGVDFKALSSQDVLGNSLLGMRTNLVEAQDEEKKRQHEDDLRKWSNEGLAQFNELLRQSAGDIDLLTASIVRHLVNFLGANQSGLFLLDDIEKEDIHLELVATYAYNKERKRQKKIYMGEGLVGMCAVEKSTVYLNDIPDGYLSISSGLGGSDPRSLLIVPLKLEDEIFGVIEIASFNKFKKHEIEFVERVTESISSTLSLAKINTRTSTLLEKSQRQAEEMAAQEEEMRQNLEELQATQEESSRKEAEMSSIINAINSSSLVIEFDLNGYIISTNQAFLSLLGLSRSEMIGKHQSDFEKMDDAHVRDDDFWEKLRRGEMISDIKSLTVNEKTHWLHQVYTPIIDADGEVYKILNLATDITESKDLEKELLNQAETMAVQEEELRKNLEELKVTQNQMTDKQLALQEANKTAVVNEQSMKEVVTKAKDQESRLRKRNAELAEREVEFRKNLQELKDNEKKLKMENDDLEKSQNKLLSNEKILKKFLKDAKENQKKIEADLKKANLELSKLKGKK